MAWDRQIAARPHNKEFVMTKIMQTTPYRLDGHARVSIAREAPTVAELTLTVGDHWHVFHMNRQQLESMHREIAAKLKEAPLPVRQQ
jgi:hypothetical protein